MAKFHISPNTGRPNKCSAQPDNCPLGVDGEQPPHFATKQEARDWYEEAMRNNTFAAHSKTTSTAREFEPDEHVRSKTAWSYDQVMEQHQGPKGFRAAYPELEFRKAPDGELVIGGTMKDVESYITGGDLSEGEVALSMSRLKGVKPKAGAVAPKAVKAAKETTKAAEAATKRAVRKVAVKIESTVSEPAPSEVLQEVSSFNMAAFDAENLALVEGEPVDLDEDFNTIRCEDCDRPLSACRCDSQECEYCDAFLGDGGEHEEDCHLFKPRPRAYSFFE